MKAALISSRANLLLFWLVQLFSKIGIVALKDKNIGQF